MLPQDFLCKSALQHTFDLVPHGFALRLSLGQTNSYFVRICLAGRPLSGTSYLIIDIAIYVKALVHTAVVKNTP